MRRKANYIRWLMCVLFLSWPAHAKYGGGTGEPNDPYLIYTAEQMNTIGADLDDWDKHFKLMADIDLSGYTGTDFNIIGIGNRNAFTGGLAEQNTGEIALSFWDSEASGQSTSDGGEGKTTAEMQTAGTFLDAGWDFVDEAENGTEDIRWILEGQDYPRLWWESR